MVTRVHKACFILLCQTCCLKKIAWNPNVDRVSIIFTVKETVFFLGLGLGSAMTAHVCLTPFGYGLIGVHQWFLAATKQLYEWFSPSVCPSVRLSVRLSVTPFWLCSHHPIIMKFSRVITSDQSDVHAKGQGQRSKVKVTEVTTQLNRFWTVTPVWIHIWWWNDAYSLIVLRKGALLFLKVIRQIPRSHGSKNCRIWPRLGVSGL